MDPNNQGATCLYMFADEYTHLKLFHYENAHRCEKCRDVIMV